MQDGNFGKGFYFTDNLEESKKYAEMSAIDKNIQDWYSGKNIGRELEIYVDIENPFIIKNFRYATRFDKQN